LRRIANLCPGMMSAGLCQTPSTILAGAALIGMGASAWLGYGLIHYRQIAVEQEAMVQRVEMANADLQDALDHLRDDTRKKLQQLKTENDRLQVRLSGHEQELILLKPGAYPSPKIAAAPKSARTPGPVVAPLGQLPMPAFPVPVAATGTKNFRTPGWVPDFFSDESDAFDGSSTQVPAPIRHGKTRR
jgi:hypothetical protein